MIRLVTQFDDPETRISVATPTCGACCCCCCCCIATAVSSSAYTAMNLRAYARVLDERTGKSPSPWPELLGALSFVIVVAVGLATAGVAGGAAIVVPALAWFLILLGLYSWVGSRSPWLPALWTVLMTGVALVVEFGRRQVVRRPCRLLGRAVRPLLGELEAQRGHDPPVPAADRRARSRASGPGRAPVLRPRRPARARARPAGEADGAAAERPRVLRRARSRREARPAPRRVRERARPVEDVRVGGRRVPARGLLPPQPRRGAARPDGRLLQPRQPLPVGRRAAAPWGELAEAVNLDLAEGVPQLVFVFVLFPDRATAKYGERGGRFALIEVGHAAQNLALRLVAEGMAGCEAGGLLDEPVKALLRLDGTGAQVALGYACGLPEIARRRGPFSRRRA